MRMPRVRSAPTNLSLDNIDLQRSTTSRDRDPVPDDHDLSVSMGFASVDLSNQDLDFLDGNRDSVTPTSAVSNIQSELRSRKIHQLFLSD